MELNQNLSEKEMVKRYIATLDRLDNPFSDYIGLLPDSLSAKAERYFEYQTKLSDPAVERKYSAEAMQILREDSKSAFKEFHEELTGLLSRHGYTFGQPDSLENNVKQRMADLMEDFRAKAGPEAEPKIVRATFSSPSNEEGRTQTVAEEVLVDELNDDKWDVVQINDIYSNIYKVVSLGWDDGIERWESESVSDALLRVGANSWDEAYKKVQRMADNDEIILADRWDVEQVYEIEVTEELSTQVTVAADSRQEAVARVKEMIDNEELVLSSDDYVGVTVGSIKSHIGGDPRDNGPFVEAGPDGEYTVRVSEFLQKTVEESGRSRKEAEQRVFEAYREQRIVLDEEDFVSREIEPAIHITENRLLEPEATRLEASQAGIDKQELKPSQRAQEQDTPQYANLRTLEILTDGTKESYTGFLVNPSDRQRHNREIPMPYSYGVVFKDGESEMPTAMKQAEFTQKSDFIFQTFRPMKLSHSGTMRLRQPTMEEIEMACSQTELQPMMADYRKDHLPYDVNGDRILSAKDWNRRMESADRNTERRVLGSPLQAPITSTVNLADGTSLSVDFNLKDTIQRILDAGYRPDIFESGTVSDHPNWRYTRTETLGRYGQGEPMASGTNAYIVFSRTSANGMAANTDEQLKQIEGQAQAAGWRIDRHYPEPQSVRLCLPFTRDGSIISEIAQETRLQLEPVLEEQGIHPGSEAAVDAHIQAFRESVERHGGAYEWTDKAVMGQWKNLAHHLSLKTGIGQHATETVSEPGLQTTAVDAKPDRNRITDVSIMKGSAGKQFIRCKVDGEQQMALPVKMMDRLALATGKVTKEDLAVKYFHDELSRDRSQDQDRGLHR